MFLIKELRQTHYNRAQDDVLRELSGFTKELSGRVLGVEDRYQWVFHEL